MKQSKSKKKKWEDHYTRKAKKERFPARSVYKLKEIQHKFKLIRRGHRILDLGCAPGAWLLFAAEQTGKKGNVAGVDLSPVTIKLPSNVLVHTGDAQTLDEQAWEILGQRFDVILSDMAPATTGNRTVDAARSFELCQTALTIAQKRLKPNGAFVCKIFQGEDFNTFLDSVKKVFKKFKVFKPQSSRKASKEIFVIGFGKKPS